MVRPQLIEFLLTIVNVGLLSVLFVLFLQMWRKTKSAFSMGLMLFALVFLLREALRVLQVLDRADGIPVIGPRVGMLIALGEAVALGILLYVVSK